MKRPKNFKKLDLHLPELFKGIGEAISHHAANIAVMVIFLVVVLLCTKAYFYRSDYFRVRTVEARGFIDKKAGSALCDELLKTYKNKSIFQINITALGAMLSARYPDAKSVIVKRDFPDRLTLFLYFRRPVALVSDTRYYPVDDDGVIVVNADPRRVTNLSIVTGIDAASVRAGRSKNIKVALELLREIKKAKFLAGNLPTRIDAGDMKSMSFYLKNGVEIRIGSENLKDRLSVLKKTLKDPRLLLDKIKYIDLRFKDVVIGPR